MNRRDFLLGGAAVLGSSAVGMPVKSFIGANGTKYVAEANADYTAEDYVQDGLVAMWDGIENAGWEIHDETATIWKNLIRGGFDFYLSSSAHFEEDHLEGQATSPDNFIEFLKGYTIEFVSRTRSYTYYNNSLLYNTILWFDPIFRGSRIFYWQQSRPVVLGHFQNSLITNSKPFPFERSSVSVVSNGTRNTTPNSSVRWNVWVKSAMYNGETTSLENHGSYSENLATSNTVSYMGGVNIDICSVRIYNKELTATQRKHNYIIDKVRFNFP